MARHPDPGATAARSYVIAVIAVQHLFHPAQKWSHAAVLDVRFLRTGTAGTRISNQRTFMITLIAIGVGLVLLVGFVSPPRQSLQEVLRTHSRY